MLDRRQLITATLVAPVLAAARPAPLRSLGFATVTQIAPGVYATVADPRQGLECYSNGGVIAGRDATLIVEGHYQSTGADLEIEVARAVSKAPLRGVVDTHYHLDHTFGNIGYVRQGIAILAHERVGPLMTERYVAMKGAARSAVLADWRSRVEQASGPLDREHKEGDLRFMTFFADAVESATIALPTESLAATNLPTVLDLGGLTAVIEFHPGHSPTDLVVRVPERDVVFTGDLLFNAAYPVTPDADMRAWRSVLDVFSAYPRKTQFVPGHGAVCRAGNVRAQADLFDHLREHAERMKAAGASAEEAQARYRQPKRFEGYGILAWDFTIGAAMRSYFAPT